MLNPERCINIITQFNRAGKKVYLSTNGTNIVNFTDKLTQAITLLGLPLDGYDNITNTLNGRSYASFERVRTILADKRWHKTKIKIGTVVTKLNLNKNLLRRLSSLLDNFPVKVWRIYEALPENRGAFNNNQLILNSNEQFVLKEIVDEITAEKHDYVIELVTRRMRSNNYFIIQPDGSVIIPVDYGDRVKEKNIGSIVKLDFEKIEQLWVKCVHTQNDIYYANLRIKDLK